MNTTTQQKGATTKKYVSETLTALANVAEMRPTEEQAMVATTQHFNGQEIPVSNGIFKDIIVASKVALENKFELSEECLFANFEHLKGAKDLEADREFRTNCGKVFAAMETHPTKKKAFLYYLANFLHTGEDRVDDAPLSFLGNREATEEREADFAWIAQWTKYQSSKFDYRKELFAHQQILLYLESLDPKPNKRQKIFKSAFGSQQVD